jgi:hypothetical protein
VFLVCSFSTGFGLQLEDLTSETCHVDGVDAYIEINTRVFVDLLQDTAYLPQLKSYSVPNLPVYMAVTGTQT